MNAVLFLKACAIWLLIALLAIVNGIVRENVLTAVFGYSIALPFSGVLLSVIVFSVTYIFFDWLSVKQRSIGLVVGIQWVLMTLAFEFFFGHFVAGKSLVDLVRIVNPLSGDLFALVLLVTLLSPWLVVKIKER